MAEEQNQSGEIMFYTETLQDHLRRKLLKRIHSTYRPLRNLWEAFDLTLYFEKEYQITQPQTDFAVMETQGNKPYYQLGCQNQGHVQGPRIDFGMVLLDPNFGLEQFLEMTKALK